MDMSFARYLAEVLLHHYIMWCRRVQNTVRTLNIVGDTLRRNTHDMTAAERTLDAVVYVFAVADADGQRTELRVVFNPAAGHVWLAEGATVRGNKYQMSRPSLDQIG